MHGGKDLKKGTFLSILKHAGIDVNDFAWNNYCKIHLTPDIAIIASQVVQSLQGGVVKY